MNIDTRMWEWGDELKNMRAETFKLALGEIGL